MSYAPIHASSAVEAESLHDSNHHLEHRDSHEHHYGDDEENRGLVWDHPGGRNDFDHQSDNEEEEKEHARFHHSPIPRGGKGGKAPFYFTGPALHTAISIAAGTVMCLFGYEQGVFGGIMVGPPFVAYFDDPTPGKLGFVTSVYDLGCFGGAVLSSFVGEKLGRRWMLLVFTVVMTIGIVIQTAALDMQWLIWGRLIAGIGNGGNTATAPVWHVECAKSEEKGRAVVKEMTVNVGGFVASNFITLVFSGAKGDAQWRFPLGIQLLFSVVILTLVWILPESPRWLLMRSRDAEANVVLQALSSSSSSPHAVQAEFAKIKESVRIEQATKASWKQVFSGGTATRRVSLGVLLQMAQQLSGINVLCYYLPLVLHRSVGLPELLSRIISTINALCYMLATWSSITVIERVGRRPLLMLSALCMSIAFLGIAISVSIGQAHPDSRLVPGIVATVFMFLYFSAFSFGWITVPWLYPAEINSLSMRSKGAALATASDWLFNFVVVQTTPVGIHHLGWFLYIVYAVFNAGFVPGVYFFIVETAGKSLEQIDRWFANNPGWRVEKVMAREGQGFDDDDDVGGGVGGSRGIGMTERGGGVAWRERERERGRAQQQEEDEERMLKEFEVGSDDDEDF